MSNALFEFMPYGAPELIEGAGQRLFRATASSIALWIVLFASVVGVLITRPRFVEVKTTVVVPYRELAAPPPLTEQLPPPQIAVQSVAAAPAAGIPVPVPDAQAPSEQTIATQQELAASTGSVEVGTGSQEIIIVQPPAAEELPVLGEFVYADEYPVLITDVVPRYPEMAREAGVEGEVLLRVLVGKDGRVAEVHIDKSIPMLDDAAVEAARKWVFKPALNNNHPVAVWITRQVRFSLSTFQGS